MADIFRVFRSPTSTNAPATDGLPDGSLAVNIPDKRMWIGDTGNDPVLIFDQKVVEDHLADAVDAHDASAISFVPGGTALSSTDVQNAIAELDGDFTTFAALKGANSGLAELDAGGKVPSAQLPSFVDDVLEYANFAALPGTGSTGIIYVTLDDNLTYRWTGTVYTEISKSLALGTTSATAYRGDHGLIAYNHSQAAHAPADADNTAANETSHADVVVDGDFPADGFLKRSGGSGNYTVDTTTYSPTGHAHGVFNRATSVLSGATVFSDIVVSEGIVTGISTRDLTAGNIGAAPLVHAHDHGDLNGLSGDDHPHYFLASGARQMTGDITFDQATTTPTISVELLATGTGSVFHIESQAVTTGTGGEMSIGSGAGSVASGAVTISSGDGASSANSGAVTVAPGSTSTGTPGALNLSGGAASAGTANGGDVVLAGGTSFGGTAGKVKVSNLELQTDMDTNGNDIIIDDAHGIKHANGDYAAKFSYLISSDINFLFTTGAGVFGPTLNIESSTVTNSDLIIDAKGTGKVKSFATGFDLDAGTF